MGLEICGGGVATFPRFSRLEIIKVNNYGMKNIMMFHIKKHNDESEANDVSTQLQGHRHNCIMGAYLFYFECIITRYCTDWKFDTLCVFINSRMKIKYLAVLVIFVSYKLLLR